MVTVVGEPSLGCVDRWNAQASSWTCETDTCSTAGGCDSLRQIVWEGSARVGCGEASGCGTSGNNVVVVCRYDPGASLDSGNPPFEAAKCDTSPPPCDIPCTPENTCSNLGLCCDSACQCDFGFVPTDTLRQDCSQAQPVLVNLGNVVGRTRSVLASVYGGHYAFVQIRPYAETLSQRETGQTGQTGMGRTLAQVEPAPPLGPPSSLPITISIASSELVPVSFFLKEGAEEPSATDNVGGSFPNADNTASELVYLPQVRTEDTVLSLGITADVNTVFTISVTMGTAPPSESPQEDSLVGKSWFLVAVSVGGGVCVCLALIGVFFAYRRYRIRQSFVAKGDTFVSSSDVHMIPMGGAHTGTEPVSSSPFGGPVNTISGPTLTSAPTRSLPGPPPKASPHAATFTALYDYEPSNKDELRLVAGRDVVVMEEYDDGWGRGRCGPSEGYFPLTYITPK